MEIVGIPLIGILPKYVYFFGNGAADGRADMKTSWAVKEQTSQK